MNHDLFNKAKEATAAKDYKSAVLAYLRCLSDSQNPPRAGEVGLVYHQLGNCYVGQGRYAEAINCYNHALADHGYMATGAVHCNLGRVFAVTKDDDRAIEHYRAATLDRRYLTPYKAFYAIGLIYLRQGKAMEAGKAFRSSALDNRNPDPARSLLHLGLCFMALDRPMDAVTCYKSALPYGNDPMVRSMVYANLGQAYLTTGDAKRALRAFKSAQSNKEYTMSASAAADFARAEEMLTGRKPAEPIEDPMVEVQQPNVVQEYSNAIPVYVPPREGLHPALKALIVVLFLVVVVLVADFFVSCLVARGLLVLPAVLAWVPLIPVPAAIVNLALPF